MTVKMNEIIKNITNEKFVGIWTVDNENYVVAFGNDEKEVDENTYFHWAVMCEYEGNYKVVETNTIKVN